MTGREIYNKALALINERDSAGEFHADAGDYEKNAHELLNVLCSRLWCDDCIVRGVSPRDWNFTYEEISSLDETLPLHPAFAPSLVFALASLLIHEEDRERADYYYRMFSDSKNSLVSSFSRAYHGSVVDVYS